MKRSTLLCAAAFAATLGAPVTAQELTTVKGTISGFECGDNCYLTIETSYGEETGLCYAAQCDGWFFDGLPEGTIGREARLTVSAGMTMDNGGNPQGLLISFEDIAFLN